MILLTQERLRALLHYDPETGAFTWRVVWGSGVARRQPGDRAGFANGDGQIRIGIDGKQHCAHRLAWLYMTGEWPKGLVDHKDLDRSNNRWSNLRAATKSQNTANSGLHVNNTSGLKGVSWNKKENKWQVNITVNKYQRRVGTFDCRAAGYFAYVIAADKAFGEFARFA